MASTLVVDGAAEVAMEAEPAVEGTDQWVWPVDAARMEELGEQLRLHAAALAAAEYRWLVLLEEFDRGGGWAVQGAKTCAHWLSWACGLSLATARDRLRVAQALPGLPLVSVAFAEGRLSYSKVRAIVRVATPDNEQVLVDYALAATASQLERVVRQHRGLVDACDEQRGVEQRSVRRRDLGNGLERTTIDLPHAEAARLHRVLDETAIRLGEDTPPNPDVEPGLPEEPVVSDRFAVPEPMAVRRADAVMVMVDTLQAHGPTPVGGPERNQIVVHVTDAAPVAATGQANPDRVDPPPEGGVVGADGPLTADEVARLGLAAAGRLPLLAAEPARPGWPDIAAARLGDGVGIGSATARLLACDAKVVWLIEDTDGAPVGITEETRTIPAHLRRALAGRDKGCRFPGCTNTRFVDAHHVWHWGKRGPTVLWNVILLCRFHHGLVHRAGFALYAYGDQTFSFHRPDGTEIPQAPASLAADPDAVNDRLAAHGITVTADSLIPAWDGTTPDYDAAAETLWRATYPDPSNDPLAALLSSPRQGPADVSAETPPTESAVAHHRADARPEKVTSPSGRGSTA